MPEFVKPIRKVVNIEDAFGELIGKKLIKDLHDNEEICPVCRGTGLCIENNPYGLSDDPIRAPATSPTSTSLSGSAKTVITVLYVIAPTVENRFRGTERFATAKPLCNAASRKKTTKKKNGSKKQKSTSQMRLGRCLQWHKATFTLTTKDISAAGRIFLIVGMKIVKSSQKSHYTYGEPKR